MQHMNHQFSLNIFVYLDDEIIKLFMRIPEGSIDESSQEEFLNPNIIPGRRYYVKELKTKRLFVSFIIQEKTVPSDSNIWKTISLIGNYELRISLESEKTSTSVKTKGFIDGHILYLDSEKKYELFEAVNSNGLYIEMEDEE